MKLPQISPAASSAITVIACITLATAPARADVAPPATLSLSVGDNETPVHLVQTVTYDDDGIAVYEGHAEPPQEAWHVAWLLEADADPSVVAWILGEVAFENNSPNPLEFDLRLDMPICPRIANASLQGGTLSLTLKTDYDGGRIETIGPDTEIWSSLADGKPAARLFIHPFFMTASGAGSSTTNTSFGEPFPSWDGPEMLQEGGMRFRFRLTAGESATFTVFYLFGAEDDNLVNCEELFGDINGDGAINVMDLLVLLASWGPCEHCPADLDGDGVVDTGDLLMLIPLI